MKTKNRKRTSQQNELLKALETITCESLKDFPKILANKELLEFMRIADALLILADRCLTDKGKIYITNIIMLHPSKCEKSINVKLSNGATIDKRYVKLIDNKNFKRISKTVYGGNAPDSKEFDKDVTSLEKKVSRIVRKWRKN
jgi:hypothetical protein